MPQPNTTSQNPKPPSTAETNLSLWMYLPRRMPSMSETATLTRCPGDLRTAAMTWAGVAEAGMDVLPGNRFIVCAGGLGLDWRAIHSNAGSDASSGRRAVPRCRLVRVRRAVRRLDRVGADGYRRRSDNSRGDHAHGRPAIAAAVIGAGE